MFEKIKENAKQFIKDIARETFDEMQPKEEETAYFELPKEDKNRLLGLSIQRTHEDLKPILPAGVAMDSCCSDLKKFGNSYSISNPVNDVIYTHFARQGFIGFQACSILCQNWLINKACALPAKDAIRPDYELSYVRSDEQELDNDFLTEITDHSNDTKGFNIKKVCRTFAEKKRQFGQILAYPIVEGADYENPFNIDGIAPNSYKGITVVDPVWYIGILAEEAISDPTSLRYFKPTYFQMPNGKKIHHSWCIFGTTNQVPDILKPTYYWGGIPIPQLIYERVYAAEKTANEAPMLAMSKRLLITDINVKSYMSNPIQAQKELETITNFRDNWGVMAKRPGENVQQIDTSLTDLDEVIMTQYQLVAAAANMPATKLLETQPKGFNSTGDYEDDQYKLLLTSIQEEDYVPLLDFHYALLSKSKYGIVRDYTVNFKEIDTPTELERAQINNTKAQTASAYVQAGVISPDEVRDYLIKDPDSGFNEIQGEIEDEPFSFEEPDGGSETSQNPFSTDDDDTEWRSTENGVPFPLTEGETTKESCNNHFEKLQEEEKQNNKKQVPLKKLLGEEFKGIKGQDAINKVYKEKRGHVKGAFHRNIIGDIDIMWGDGTCGLSHILNQRRHRKEDAHHLLRTIGKVINKGKIAPDKYESSRWCISYKGKRAIISTELRDEKSVCLLTGFFA